MTTVAKNKLIFTRMEIEATNKARELYELIGRPGYQRFERIVGNNEMKNCPVNVSDVKRMNIIYGPDVATLKGRMVNQKPSAVLIFEPVVVPEYILQYHGKVYLAADFFYVLGLVFILTKSRKIQLLTGTHVQNRNKQTQLDVLNKVFDIYENRGFEITSLITDIEFECIRNDIRQIESQTVPADDHVGDIEVSVKLVKEDLRCTVQGLPYKRYPKLMIIEMVVEVLRKRNQFPTNDGVSDKISPLTIVNGDGPPDFNKMKFEFGAYGQAFQSNSPTNTNTTRSVGAIALSMTPNKNVEYKFMSLNTGKLIHRRQCKALPITDEVIRRVHELAKRDNQSTIDKCEISVEW